MPTPSLSLLPLNDELARELSLAADPGFVPAMVLHLWKFFPDRFASFDDPALRETVRQGIETAAGRGLVTKRDVCLYIDYAMLFGSDVPPDGDINALYRGRSVASPTAAPAFAIIGAPKCATTSMCELLGLHPDVFMCQPKEPDFFSVDEIFALGTDWYASLFLEAGARVAGEGSTSYSIVSNYPSAAPRLAQHNPECRIIYMVRHPLHRIESHWREEQKWVDHAADISLGGNPRNLALVDTSCYWRQLSRYRDFFPDQQILVLFFEDFLAAPDEQIRRCLEHIGVSVSAAIPSVDRARNASSDWRVETPIASFLHRFPGPDALWNAAPEWMRRVARPFLTREFFSAEDLHPAWEPGVRHAVLDALADDAAALLAHCGKPADYWDLDA